MADPSKSSQGAVTVTSTPNFQYAEVESNGTIATANILPSGNGYLSGTVSGLADIDIFAVPVGAGRTLSAILTNGDLVISLVDTSGATLSSMTGAGATLTYTNSTTGTVTVYVRVNGYRECVGGLIPSDPGINPDPNPCVNMVGPYTVSIQR